MKIQYMFVKQEIKKKGKRNITLKVSTSYNEGI